MKLLVTGGAGFIGSNFVNHWLLNHKTDSIIVVDNLTYASNLRRLKVSFGTGRIVLLPLDIRDYKSMSKVIDMNIDAIVHFAAETHVDRSLSGYEAEKLFMRTNYEGTMSLLHAAKNAGVRRFHHVSTDEVFGDLEFDDKKFHENFPYNAKNPYSISKAAADFAVRSFGTTYDLDFTISNCTNNYGPFQTPEKLIPRSILLLLEDKKVQLYTDENGVAGRNVRDWLHVTDHCTAIESILLKGKIGETYCVGGNSELTNFQLIMEMFEQMKKITGINYEYETHVDLVKDRPGHDKRYAMSTEKIKNELGWSPSYSLESGLQSTVMWYLSDEGKKWLKSMQMTSCEVRENQAKKELENDNK